jgi:hypothetical protein
LRSTGASVAAIQLAVADDAALDHALSALKLRGVIHAAGTLDDGLVLSQDWKRVCRVLCAESGGGCGICTG